MILVHQRQTKTRKFSKTWPFKSVTDEMFGRLPTERKGANKGKQMCKRLKTAAGNGREDQEWKLRKLEKKGNSRR